MSSAPPLPSCPRCGRRIAAWKMDHCVYCGAAFPADFKQGLPEPEGLKWVERPPVPPDAAKQLEMMKVVPLEGKRSPRSFVKIVTIVSIPLFAIIFFALHSLVGRVVDRYLPGASSVVLIAGLIFLGYLLWTVFRGGRK